MIWILTNVSKIMTLSNIQWIGSARRPNILGNAGDIVKSYNLKSI